MTPRSDEAGLTSIVRDLREMSGEPDWQQMEGRLLASFAEASAKAAAQTSNGKKVATSGSEEARRQPWRWTAAAAMVVLAAAITFYPPRIRPGTVVAKPPDPAPSSRLPTPATPEPKIVTPPSPSAPAKPAPSKPAPRSTARRSGPALPTVGARTEESDGGADEFVALPVAFGLPDFESGRIVRVEVPLTVLPAYGIDLVPDASPAAVQADFLIGQDGVPRAIRLAANSQRQ